MSVLKLLQDGTCLPRERILEILANPNPHYHRYHIRQRNKSRQIEEPTEELKELQYAILPLFMNYPLHKASYSVRGKGVKANAEEHRGAEHILRVDIKGCYQAITKDHLAEAWLKTRFWLDYWNFIDLCLIKHKGKLILPTGAPTSPILCNIALTPLDLQVTRLAWREGYRYTRYLDDLVLSTSNPKRNWELLDEVTWLIEQMGMKTNKKKCRWARKNVDSLQVTGVTIGERNSANRELRKRLRARLNNLARDGLGLDPVTMGYLAYVKSIDEDAYLKLMDYYQKRQRYVPPQRISSHPQ